MRHSVPRTAANAAPNAQGATAYSLHRDHQHVLVVDVRDIAEVAIGTVQITVEPLGIISF